MERELVRLRAPGDEVCVSAADERGRRVVVEEESTRVESVVALHVLALHRRGIQARHRSNHACIGASRRLQDHGGQERRREPIIRGVARRARAEATYHSLRWSQWQARCAGERRASPWWRYLQHGRRIGTWWWWWQRSMWLVSAAQQPNLPSRRTRGGEESAPTTPLHSQHTNNNARDGCYEQPLLRQRH